MTLDYAVHSPATELASSDDLVKSVKTFRRPTQCAGKGAKYSCVVQLWAWCNIVVVLADEQGQMQSGDMPAVQWTRCLERARQPGYVVQEAQKQLKDRDVYSGRACEQGLCQQHQELCLQ